MPVSFVAVRQGSGILFNSMLIIASVRISDFDVLWKKMNSLKYPPGNSVWSMSCRHSSGGLKSRSRANVTSMCRARALWRTRGEAQGRGGAGTSGRRGSRQIEGRKGQNLNSELQTVLTLIYKPEPKRLRSQERS